MAALNDAQQVELLNAARDTRNRTRHAESLAIANRVDIIAARAEAAAGFAALAAVVKQLPGGATVDLAEVKQAAEDGAADALSRVSLVVDPAPEPEPAAV